MSNRLIHQKSLYLRQHAENPVDWYPWGEEAFQKAQAGDKPILVSIGYSSCHWCHVMAHESFEDAYIAKLMNTHFVCIKVDREERPEVDQIYMDAVQMLNGHGGWPLNVFCLPDGRPFAGGTYFPPDDGRGHNIVPWPQLLIRVADYYMRQRADLEENAKAIIGNLEASNHPHQATGEPVGKDDFLVAMDRLQENHDAEFGGFGTAPKFPPSMTLDFLLGLRASATIELKFPDKANALDGTINRTLTGMAHGGIFDQIGGGFSRYSVDQHWLIPHFEKMLYDNALLLDIYSKAFQRYPKPLYRQVVVETCQWLEREMHSPEGGYFAALDADTEGEEGKTYVWNPAQVKAVLGKEEGARFCEVYGITTEGNFENSGQSNPALLSGEATVRDSLQPAREKLLAARQDRPQPGRDDKCLTAWNALLVRGLARASFTFGEDKWLEAARTTANWIWETMRRDGARLHTVAYGNVPSGNGTLNDYAYAAEAFLALAAVVEWQHPGEAAQWIERSRALIDVVQEHFQDAGGIGYYFTSDDHQELVHRKKEWYDNATPSGNSSLVQSCAALEVITGDSRYSRMLDQLQTAYPGITRTSPAAGSHALSGFVYRAIGISTIKVRPGTDVERLREALTSRPWRPVFLLQGDPAEQSAAYQLCVGTQCLAPTDSLEELMEKL